MNAKDYALHLLTVQDRTEAELYRKLQQKGFEEAEIAPVMAFCVEYQFLDDARYAARFCRDAMQLRHFGKLRIRQELRRRGVSDALITQTLDDVETDESETVLEQMKHRFSDADVRDPKVRNRIFGYFARRGYQSRDIVFALRNLGVEADFEE